jgi:hypothetical protein
MIKPIKPPERTFGFGGLIMNKEFKSKCLFFLMVQDLNSCFRVVFLARAKEQERQTEQTEPHRYCIISFARLVTIFKLYI